MGMDVFGREPSSERGEYFRSNVWWWHPLAAFVQEVCPRESEGCEYWHSNDGDGLDREQTAALVRALDAALEAGKVDAHAEQLKSAAAVIDREICRLCDGSGLRRDEIGRRHGFDRRDPDSGEGGCNGCQGVGTTMPPGSDVCFTREHVEEFLAFLRDCGGFDIC